MLFPLPCTGLCKGWDMNHQLRFSLEGIYRQTSLL